LAALVLAGLSSAGSPASAQTYSSPPPPPPHHHYHHYARHDRYGRPCEYDRRNRANTGTAVGAVGGGVLGATLSHGHLGGTLLGAGAGAVAGHEIGKHTARC
jgi:hypothetical protein